jgi:hypothetical protein
MRDESSYVKVVTLQNHKVIDQEDKKQKHAAPNLSKPKKPIPPNPKPRLHYTSHTTLLTNRALYNNRATASTLPTIIPSAKIPTNKHLEYLS